MGFAAALSHLFGFLMPALGTALIAFALRAAYARVFQKTPLFAPQHTSGVAWAFMANVVVLGLALWLLGRDGKVSAYAGVAIATAAVLWWKTGRS